jgi:hypothetical protein
MKKLSKEKRDQIVLVIIASVALIGGFWYLVIRAQLSALRGKQQQTKAAQEKVEKAQRMIQRSAETEAGLAGAQDELKRIEDQMASGDLYSWVILTINKFRAPYNVDIPNFSREQMGELGLLPGFPYKAATFTLRGTAWYHDLGRFIAEFENQYPHAVVQNLELEPAISAAPGTMRPGDDSEKLAFRMDLVALVKPKAADSE